MDTVKSVALAGSLDRDLSMWGLFFEADPVVKVVMLVLVLASFWCWAVIFDKSFRIRRLTAQANRFEESFWSGGSLDDLYDRIGSRPTDPMSAIFTAAMRELRQSPTRGLAGDDGRPGLARRYCGLTSLLFLFSELPAVSCGQHLFMHSAEQIRTL